MTTAPVSRFHKVFRISTLLFFIAGTCLLIAHLIDPAQQLEVIGYVYTKLSFAVNYLLLLIVLFRLVSKPDKRDSQVTAGIMLLNIPVALVYMYIVLGPDFARVIPLVMVPFTAL